MSWQDHVARQQAAQLSADALARAARGEEFGDVAREGPRAVPTREAVDVVALEGRTQQALPPPLQERPRERPRMDPRMIEAFCGDLSDVFGHVGYTMTPRLVFRVMQQLASEGWVIDVNR